MTLIKHQNARRFPFKRKVCFAAVQTATTKDSTLCQ